MQRSPSIFLERVRRTVAREGMIAPGETVLAAVSGGADSMALLHALLALGHAAEVAHLDHGTRDGGSAEDAAFVAAEAARLGLPCHAIRRDIPGEARAAGLSFEVHARAVRYAFLRETAEARGCAVVATGHHRDDQAETVLLRLLRGAGPGGIAGIPPVRPLGKARVVRPLLDCARGDIEAWLREAGHTWREDHTNADPCYRRNRVRHGLLPTLEACFPEARDTLVRAAEMLRRDNDLLDSLANAAERTCCVGGRVDRAAFRTLPEALRRRVLLRYAHGLGAAPGYAALVAAAEAVADGPVGAACELDGGLRVYLGRVYAEPMTQDAPAEVVPLAVPGETAALGLCFHARVLDRAPVDLAAYCHARRQVLDADVLDGAVVRTRRPGDRFHPLGAPGRRKLKKWFIDRGVPRPRRDACPLLARGGEVLWVVGGPPAAAVAVTEATRNIVEVTVDDASE